MSRLPPSPYSVNNWQDWANQMVEYIQNSNPSQAAVTPRAVLLEHQVTSVLARATTDGILMWDASVGTMVVSKGGVWVPVGTLP